MLKKEEEKKIESKFPFELNIYTFHKEIGKGEFGLVYLATKKECDEKFAVKETSLIELRKNRFFNFKKISKKKKRII